MRAVLQQIQAIANVTFQEVTQTATAVGDIAFGFGPTGGGGALPPGPNSGGDVFLNSNSVTKSTVLHEVLHALGLKHPVNYLMDNYSPNFSEDPTRQFTAMSYQASDYSASYQNANPSLFDVAVLHHLYGAREQALGDTDLPLKFHPGVGRVFWIDTVSSGW